VLATSKNMRIPADGTRSDNSYLPTHAFLPAFLAAEASALAGLITTVEPRRARHLGTYEVSTHYLNRSVSRSINHLLCELPCALQGNKARHFYCLLPK
jgi:hypothetical protein